MPDTPAVAELDHTARLLADHGIPLFLTTREVSRLFRCALSTAISKCRTGTVTAIRTPAGRQGHYRIPAAQFVATFGITALTLAAQEPPKKETRRRDRAA